MTGVFKPTTHLLLKVTGQHVDGFRDHVIFSVAMGTGLREHELLALDDALDRLGAVDARARGLVGSLIQSPSTTSL